MWDDLVTAESEVDYRTGRALREAEQWRLARLAIGFDRVPRWQKRAASISDSFRSFGAIAQAKLSEFLVTALCSLRSRYAQRDGQSAMVARPC
jgi:hypothetical protein